MGNTINVKLPEERCELEITETLIQEFQDRINLVDHSMAGFAKSIDSMGVTCGELLRLLDNNESLAKANSADSDKSDKVDSTQLARHLVKIINTAKRYRPPESKCYMLFATTFIEYRGLYHSDDILFDFDRQSRGFDSVSDHKFVLMESISNLFHFILDLKKRLNVNLAEIMPIELATDNYRIQSVKEPIENSVPYYDYRIESLQKEVAKLEVACISAREEIANLSKREQLYKDEIDTLNKYNEDMEKEMNKLNTRKRELDNEKNINEKGTDELKTEIFTSKKALEQLGRNLEDEIKKNEEERHQSEKLLEDTKTAAENEIKKLKEEAEKNQLSLEALAKENEVMKKNMIAIKNINEETLKHKSGEIHDLNKEILQMSKNKSTKLEKGKENTFIELEKQLNEEKNKNNVLSEELKALKETKVLKAFFQEPSRKIRYTLKDEILALLKGKVSKYLLDLDMTEWYPSRHTGIQPDLPIIVLCHCSIAGRKKTMHEALKSLNVTPKVAVLMVYDADNVDSCKQMRESIGDGYKDLGGIFEISYSLTMSDKGHLHANEENCNAVIDFLRREGIPVSRNVEM